MCVCKSLTKGSENIAFRFLDFWTKTKEGDFSIHSACFDFQCNQNCLEVRWTEDTELIFHFDVGNSRKDEPIWLS